MTLLDRKQQTKLYWWGVILHFSLSSAHALVTTLIAALVGVKWELISHQEKFLIVVAILANWLGLVVVFVQKGMARLASGKPPIETGDTDQLTKA